MAFRPIGNFFTDERNLYEHDQFNIGDTVEYIGNRSTTYYRGEKDVVTEVTKGSYDYSLAPVITNPDRTEYQCVYRQNIKTKAGGNTYRNSRSFKKVGNNMPLALESNRPVIVQEIEEVVEGTNTVIRNIGDPIPLDSLSAARVYTTNEISNSIREKNIYRQFRIYQEHSVARAKKPEIEFA